MPEPLSGGGTLCSFFRRNMTGSPSRLSEAQKSEGPGSDRREIYPPYPPGVASSAAAAIRATHQWFERNVGWSPPDPGTLSRSMSDGGCPCPDGCLVAPAESCPHGLASWWLVLRTLDRPDATAPMPPPRLTPHPDRLDRQRGQDYVAIMDAHHGALLAGDEGYFDPASGLFVQTARTLWDRGSCCQQGCRHCPYLDR
jgi:hypothetical protein